MYRCRHTYLRQQVIVGIQTFDTVGALVHQTDVDILTRQQFSQVRAYLACSYNNHSHNLFCLVFRV